jgi:hypothetical protein
MKRVTQFSKTFLPDNDDAKLRIVARDGGVRRSVSVTIYCKSSVSYCGWREKRASLFG